jgi:moderate conductance mechanosensitive channel
MKTEKLLLLLLLVLPLTLAVPLHSFAAEQTATEDVSLDGIAPDQVDSVLAKMSDEQVRSLLVSELSKNLPAGSGQQKGKGGLVHQATGLLHLLDKDENKKENAAGFLSSLTTIPGDYIAIARKIGDGSLGRFIGTVAMFAALFGLAWLSEFSVRRFTANFSKQFQEKGIPDLDGPMRFIAGIMRSLPALIHILTFSGSAIFLFFLLPASALAPARYLFLTVLFSIIFYRILAEISRIFCAPQSPALRVLPIDDATATALHKGILFFCSFTFVAVLFLALCREVQLKQASLALTAMFFASFLIFTIVFTILRSRASVRERILEKSDRYKTRNWVVEQFAQFWHVPAILYFTIIWLVMVGDQLAGVQRGNSAFLMSLLILPLFVLFNGVGQWVVRVSIKTLRIYNPDSEDPEDKQLRQKLDEAKERERKLFVTSGRLMSLGILATLLVWVLSLWGVHIPYATNITRAVFESLIALALGLTVWRFASSYIEKKILESTPEKDDEEESDDEWGGAATKGRSHTLLPMLRKFIASTLLVMVVLVILSSLGVDIGPLLAGAGVVGLAIGFGAQKLVSDVFSGFFYLLDDAFRVGEYIKAGSVMGAVESITLRNVMLRHHRGMLQIVPHSELGSITNFMRGGIIEKFNLEFPYDADVDKIRKVIKKVGQAMLKDEEFANDFINPVKSAGVREITGSVMVIRVKFKTQPGAQFVIRREAYRRITDALAAQGIHYAHRKVIVELPEHEKKSLSAEDQKLLEAGAAAAILQQQEEEKKLAEEQNKK